VVDVCTPLCVDVGVDMVSMSRIYGDVVAGVDLIGVAVVAEAVGVGY